MSELLPKLTEAGVNLRAKVQELIGKECFGLPGCKDSQGGAVRPCMLCESDVLFKRACHEISEPRSVEVGKDFYRSLLSYVADSGCMCEHNKADLGCEVPCLRCKAHSQLERMEV